MSAQTLSTTFTSKYCIVLCAKCKQWENICFWSVSNDGVFRANENTSGPNAHRPSGELFANKCYCLIWLSLRQQLVAAIRQWAPGFRCESRTQGARSHTSVSASEKPLIVPPLRMFASAFAQLVCMCAYKFPLFVFPPHHHLVFAVSSSSFAISFAAKIARVHCAICSRFAFHWRMKIAR